MSVKRKVRMPVGGWGMGVARDLSARLPASIDSDELPAKVGEVDECLVDAPGKVRKRRVGSADDNARVVGGDDVQANEVATIEGDHRTIRGNGKGHDILVRHCLPGPATVCCGQDIVSKTPQCLHGIEREILVGIQARQGSCVLVLGDLCIDLGLVRAGIGPGIGQILSLQQWVVAQQVGLRSPLLSQSDQHPYGNTGPDDAGIPTADTRIAVNTWKRIAQISDDPLQYLRLLGAAQFADNLLQLIALDHSRLLRPRPDMPANGRSR